MRLKTRTLCSLIPVALVTPMNVGVPAGPIADGYTITIKVSDQAANLSTAILKIAGDNMRLESPDIGAMMGRGGGGNAAMVNGAFMLPGSDNKMIIVLPNAPNMMGGGGTGMALSMDLAAVTARMGAAPSTAEPAIQELGAGENLLGYTTRKYRVTQGENVVDMWMADIPGIDFKKFAMGFGARFSGISPRTAEKTPSGFVLKAVSSGKDNGSMEVTKIEKTSFVDTDFQVPAGIQVLDMGGIMGGRGRGNQ